MPTTQSPHMAPSGETRRSRPLPVVDSVGPVPGATTHSPFSPTSHQRVYGNRAVNAYLQRQMQTGNHAPGCGCPACTNLQRQAQVAVGDSLVQRHSSEEGDHSHGAGCGCSMCGVVQRAVEISSQSRGSASRERVSTLHTPAYDSAHAVQRKAVRIQQRAPGAHSAHPFVQRHSSWEHMLIGELETDELTLLGAAYDAQAAGPNGNVNIPTAAGGNRNIQIANVQHLIEQEIGRLSHMMDTEPKIKKKDVRDKGSKEINWAKAATAKRKEETRLNVAEGSGTWQVEFVLIPTVEGDLLPVTYGELNTLADFYGSVDELKEADPSWLKRVIRGVRMSSVEKLTALYKEVTGRSQNQLKQGVPNLQSRTAKMPIGPTSDIWMGSDAGELRQMGILPSSDEKSLSGGGKQSTGYQATLARNACHFAPESWHSWADNHAKARAAATLAFQASRTGNTKLAAQKRNEALLYNGFGDHYLQDSYAAGHLINKTQIMQWYVQWIDTDASDRWKQYFDKNWRKMQQMAYNQGELTAGSQYNKANVRQGDVSTARNPQAVRTNQAGRGWQAAANALHLQAPSSLSDPDAKAMLDWWQRTTATQWKIRNPRKQSFSTLRGIPAFNGDRVRAGNALLKLLQDGVVRSNDYKTSDLAHYKSLQAGQLNPRNSESFLLREEYAVDSVANLPATGGDSQRKGQGVAFEDYKYFIKSTFLQKATNALHNYFCLNGLEVAGDAGPVFKVYGDDNMFKAGAAPGLKHSSETAKMSKQAITDIIAGGVSAHTQASILARLPSKVKLADYQEDPTIKAKKTGDQIVGTSVLPPMPGARWNAPGQTVSLEEWHNGKMGDTGPLRDFCFNMLFPAMTDERGGNIIGPALMSELGEPTPERVHSGDKF